jgi:hypothetical protein
MRTLEKEADANLSPKENGAEDEYGVMPSMMCPPGKDAALVHVQAAVPLTKRVFLPAALRTQAT